MIVFSLYLHVAPEKRVAVLRILGATLGPTRVAPGCLAVRILVDIDEGKRFVLVEEWETREHFEAYLDAKRLEVIVAVIDLSNEAPIVQIDTVMREIGIHNLPFERLAVRRATS